MTELLTPKQFYEALSPIENGTGGREGYTSLDQLKALMAHHTTRRVCLHTQMGLVEVSKRHVLRWVDERHTRSRAERYEAELELPVQAQVYVYPKSYVKHPAFSVYIHMVGCFKDESYWPLS